MLNLIEKMNKQYQAATEIAPEYKGDFTQERDRAEKTIRGMTKEEVKKSRKLWKSATQ